MKRLIVALISLSLLVSGCVTTHTVSPPGSGSFTRAELHAGDRVEITLKSGNTRRLKLSAIDSQTLTGRDLDTRSDTSVQVNLADVKMIEVRRTSGLRTAAVGLGVVVGVAVVLVGALLIKCGGDNDRCSD